MKTTMAIILSLVLFACATTVEPGPDAGESEPACVYDDTGGWCEDADLCCNADGFCRVPTAAAPTCICNELGDWDGVCVPE